jgi:hypothetical protein
MAFCNSCGTALDAGARFCPKCGAATTAAANAAPATGAAMAAGAPPQGNTALKVILIVLAAIIGLGILSMATCGFILHRMVRRARIENGDGSVRVETPFGSVDTITDPNVAARNLGVDLYPGATIVKGGAADMSFGSMHTTAAEFETSDSASAVADFYKSKFPAASFVSSDNGHYSIMAGDKNNMTTINIEPRGGMTRIHIAKVTGKGGS